MRDRPTTSRERRRLSTAIASALEAVRRVEDTAADLGLDAFALSEAHRAYTALGQVQSLAYALPRRPMGRPVGVRKIGGAWVQTDRGPGRGVGESARRSG